MAQTNFDVFKGKDCGFVADWLKTKGLHKLCSVFEVIKNHFILSMNISIYIKNSNLEIFPGVGAFDHLKWTYDGAFEQLFDSGRGDLHKNFPKIQMPGKGREGC